MMESLDKIIQVLKQSNNFLITSHVNPDGDAIGSMSAMAFILQTLGKKFCVYNESPIPDKFNWVKWPASVSHEYEPGKHEWMIVLDCGDLDRAGEKLAGNASGRIINIDHHLGNPEFGDINWIKTDASSVGEMVATIAEKLDIELSGPLAQGIYLALVSDTGFFSYGNTSVHSLELTARLINNGLVPGRINPVILNQWTVGRLHLHGLAMQQSSFHLDNRIGLVSVTKEMLDKTGTTPDDCEGLVSAVRNVKSVDVAISVREDEPGKIKFSLRSSGDINVQSMARELGGGGHKNASGGIIYGSMDHATSQLLDVAMKQLS
ncbi:DHH family phosphoesterase [Desulfonatronovibrio magnus]|uniref:DHH family phosphoesterase n=1 Tax=Desulfonatronovibrio magnus TaxID=698827 RepID=UPI0005EB6634|nr:bifunctional oligoribonuclease/PAP phosphatase NrnA [Desulfonatronovibrio magnus]